MNDIYEFLMCVNSHWRQKGWFVSKPRLVLVVEFFICLVHYFLIHVWVKDMEKNFEWRTFIQCSVSAPFWIFIIRCCANWGETKFSQCHVEPRRHPDISTSSMIHTTDEALLPKGLTAFSFSWDTSATRVQWSLKSKLEISKHSRKRKPFQNRAAAGGTNPNPFSSQVLQLSQGSAFLSCAHCSDCTGKKILICVNENWEKY